MNVTSSTRDRNAEIDRCLSMIVPSASDESKFVGMLMLPKLLDHNDVDLIERAFKGMNFLFIERLLRTNHKVDAEIPDQLLKEIAINILACFSRYNTLSNDKNMVERIPGLSRLLSADNELTTEILQILLCVSTEKQGLVKMLDPDVVKNVLEVVIESKKTETRQLASQLLVSVYTRSARISAPSINQALAYSLSTTLFPILCKTIDRDQKLIKFEALTLLSSILPEVPAEKLKNESKLPAWLDHLLAGLRQILTSKIRFSLRCFGNQWLFSSLAHTKSAKRRKEKAPVDDKKTAEAYQRANFPALLIHLISIEAKIMLDDISEHTLREHNEEKKIVNKTQRARQERMLPEYFDILENAMEYLATQEDSTEMDPEMLLKIRTTLSDVMDVVMELLRFKQGMVDRPEDLDKDIIAQACIRIVSIWMAEEGYEIGE
ncbi:hypothetical protein G6F56_007655 [Rhizopus delemar]|uniref:Neurochondrin-domain-containing protein n=1 Tax=Rhizopus stolonifer TaxID=4846 RepID=A0A367KXP9_RHIST|nr:hypothetical protein G6F56_007655 [Rhizopus delemar]RCI06988.1 hypothetical protein CU098_005329 [Rhizopus stolonifer]